jgi:hypothetical protein
LGEEVGHQSTGRGIGRMDDDQPLPGPSGEDREQVRILHEPPWSNPIVGANPQGGDDRVALVALEGMHGAYSEVELLDVIGGERGQDGLLEGVGLGPERCHHPDAHGVVAVEDPQLPHDLVDLGRHHAAGVAPPFDAHRLDTVHSSVRGDRRATWSSPP